jgi:murein DD-endopeptidase MepM/ murein hydrolase activator NlpD
MPRRVTLCLLAALLFAAPALAGDIVSQKRQVDTKISAIQGRIAAAQSHENALRGQIAGITTQIRSLERQVGDVSAKLDVLTRDLALHQRRLDELNVLYDVQTHKYEFERQQYAVAVDRLRARLVAIYESADPTALDIVLATTSVNDTLDQLDFLKAIGDQDKRIAAAVGIAKHQARTAQLRTLAARKQVRSEVQVVAVRTYQVGAVKAQLLGAHSKLTTTRQRQRQSLVSVIESKKEYLAEEQGLEAASAALTAKIQAAQAARAAGGDTTPSPSGLIWPVSGPVTSPFGMRWGRMHEGIDIGVPEGTPIHAAAAGIVIYAGWEDGYGNLVVLDNGGNIATAYAHQSQIAVSMGQQVAQGQVIGYSGCTGHCLGPHLHFEVRVNGQPVDPLGYL